MPATRGGNLSEFFETVKEAYTQTKRRGLIPSAHLNTYDALIACPAVVTPRAYGQQGGWAGRPLKAHRLWRRRVARAWAKSQGRPLLGFFDFDLDWQEMWDWILENIIPIMKMLLTIVPFII